MGVGQHREAEKRGLTPIICLETKRFAAARIVLGKEGIAVMAALDDVKGESGGGMDAGAARHGRESSKLNRAWPLFA